MRVDLQMQWRYRFAILLATVVAAVVLAQPVLAANSGFLSGSVFIDANGNGRIEPGESRVPDATVHVRSRSDSTLEIVTRTDQRGYFILDNMPLGLYDVWASVSGTGSRDPLTFELAEVNAQVLLDVPVSASVQPAQSKSLFLPLVASA